MTQFGKYSHGGTQLSRRLFLGGATASLAGSGILGQLAHAAVPIGGAGGNGDYRALVCILLAGGCDSFNLLMPKTGVAYDAYAAARTNLAIDSGDSLEIQDAVSGDRFGLHPATEGLQTLFNEDRLGFVANIGTLVTPTDKEKYEAGAVPLPAGLMSHSDQIRQWQTSNPQNRNAKGWGGVAQETRLDPMNLPEIPANISLSGSNVFQFGNFSNEYAITERGSQGIWAFEGMSPERRQLREGLQNMLQQTGGDRKWLPILLPLGSNWTRRNTYSLSNMAAGTIMTMCWRVRIPNSVICLQRCWPLTGRCRSIIFPKT